MTAYPKCLIEVDLPIKRISAHAAAGEVDPARAHLDSAHGGWAPWRPAGPCLCMALWPDPADPICPQSFRDAASRLITDSRRKSSSPPRSTTRFLPSRSVNGKGSSRPRNKDLPSIPRPGSSQQLRFALLDFIADFANWDNSTVPAYLETSRALPRPRTKHSAAAGYAAACRGPVCRRRLDSLEALRVGADAFASDLNPIPVLLNKVVLEYIPKYGHGLQMRFASGASGSKSKPKFD